MINTASIDSFIKFNSIDTTDELAGFYIVPTFIIFMFTLLFTAISFDGNPPLSKFLLAISVTLGIEHIILVPWLIKVYKRMIALKNIKLGEKFSKLKSYSIKLINKDEIHYLTWCGCDNSLFEWELRQVCVHNEVKIPIDITDSNSQSRAISKLEKLYTSAQLEYERYKGNETAAKERLEMYTEDVKSRLREYNKLTKELSTTGNV